MSNIFQNLSITKHINPSTQISDEYTLMITYHDTVYSSKIKSTDFESNLFEFDMLEQLIYNCNREQKVGDVSCLMNIKESESYGKILDIILYFERCVKPMKQIYEEHKFQLLDKNCLAVCNLRNEINFVTIKPTTKIVEILIKPIQRVEVHEQLMSLPRLIKIVKIYHDNPKFKTDIEIIWKDEKIDKINSKIMTIDPDLSEFNKFIIFKDNDTVCNALQLYVTQNILPKISKCNTVYVTQYSVSNINIICDNKTGYNVSNINILDNNKFESTLDYYLKTNYVDMIKIKDDNKIIIFIDETKKPNNRKIKFFDKFEKFIESREQFKTYHILDMNAYGVLIEEV